MSSYKASVCYLRVCLSVFTPSHFLHLSFAESAANWKIQESDLRPLAQHRLKAEFILSFSSLGTHPSQLTTEVSNSVCLLNFPKGSCPGLAPLCSEIPASLFINLPVPGGLFPLRVLLKRLSEWPLAPKLVSAQISATFNGSLVHSGGASQVALVIKNPPANAGDIRDAGSIPMSERSPGGGHGNSLQYSCLENPMDRGAWRATVLGVAKSRT